MIKTRVQWYARVEVLDCGAIAARRAIQEVKVIYRITYPTGKIYIGKDSTNSARYMGSPNRLLINADFETLSEEVRRSYSLHKEILWQSDTATGGRACCKGS
jgi:hypothetical protein